PIWHTS
ncbi:EAL domain protein, partial [Vibrio parahaemolyticus V-223/04]